MKISNIFIITIHCFTELLLSDIFDGLGRNKEKRTLYIVIYLTFFPRGFAI